MDNNFYKKSAENDDCNLLFNNIFKTIVKALLNKEKEISKLSLRKNKLNDILSSKRKINFNSEINSKFNEEYSIDLNDLSIPEEQKIDINKFYENVSYTLYNITKYR